jgi:cation transport regulator ChaC
MFTGVKTDRVYGVIFEIAESERKQLGEAEGLGKGYKEEMVKVITSEGETEHMTYIATEKEPALRPYRWYKVLTVTGAVEHALPSDYIEWIRTVESVEDPNPKRRADNEALLFIS